VLIDSGSAHSFLDETTANSLQCDLQETHPLSILITDGARMVSHRRCVGFKWLMSGQEFLANLRILKLGGCHVVLGVDWMKSVSPLVFDFNTLEVTFRWEDQQVTLHGS